MSNSADRAREPAQARFWTQEEDDILRSLYLSHQRIEIAQALGRTKGSIRKRCSVLGLNFKRPPIAAWQLDTIRSWYEERRDTLKGDFVLDEIALAVGMSKANVAREARKMGLTDTKRGWNDSNRKRLANNTRAFFQRSGHPRGMLGKRHTAESRAKQSKGQQQRTRDPKQEAARIEKMMATKIARYGSGNAAWLGCENPYSRTKSGKRADLGGQFFRSAWEANYARYLNWLMGVGEVRAWEFEPYTFRFEGETRGVISYTPDFLVTFPDGHTEWHELKGWMDEKSKARLKKMKKHYPGETIVLIDAKVYRGIERSVSRLIAGWESSK